jgi:hypothetical protein
MLDFLTNELFAGDSDLKFVSWEDFDKALESDTKLKKKLTNIGRDKQIHELKNLIYSTQDNEVFERPSIEPRKIYQKFIPYDAVKYQNLENQNDVYYYNNNIVKRDENQMK